MQVHWYGNCRKGSSREKACCSNAALLKSGFDWTQVCFGVACSLTHTVTTSVCPSMCLCSCCWLEGPRHEREGEGGMRGREREACGGLRRDIGKMAIDN